MSVPERNCCPTEVSLSRRHHRRNIGFYNANIKHIIYPADYGALLWQMTSSKSFYRSTYVSAVCRCLPSSAKLASVCLRTRRNRWACGADSEHKKAHMKTLHGSTRIHHIFSVARLLLFTFLRRIETSANMLTLRDRNSAAIFLLKSSAEGSYQSPPPSGEA